LTAIVAEAGQQLFTSVCNPKHYAPVIRGVSRPFDVAAAHELTNDDGCAGRADAKTVGERAQ
jgi:hypothetical protein